MTRPTVDTNTRRRDFLALTAAVATTVMAARPALASPSDDGVLLALEEKFFEQYNAAYALHPEIERLSEIWQATSLALYDARRTPDKFFTEVNHWEIVAATPECAECNRLCMLEGEYFAEMEALVKQMWAIPALTPEGRRAKVLVALRLLPDHWREVDEKTEYGILEARQLLIELVGGEPGAQLRDQFASRECA